MGVRCIRKFSSLPRESFAMLSGLKTSIVLYGASGRMGESLLSELRRDPHVEVVAAMVRAGSECVGAIVPDITKSNGQPLFYRGSLFPDERPDVMIDFSTGAAFDNGLAIAVERNLAFVSGTTGINATQSLALRHAAKRIPVLWSANFSLGVALLKVLSAQAARVLAEGFDVEILEVHHGKKEDAPSGTALALGEVIAEVRGQRLDAVARRSRDGLIGPRSASEIGFSTIRGGDVIGEHSVLFLGQGERLEITHRATDRALFARGALRAARWMRGRPAGLYTMEQVIAQATQAI